MSVSTRVRFIARAPDICNAMLLHGSLERVEFVLAFVTPDGHRRAACIRSRFVSGLADDPLGDSEPLGWAQRAKLLKDLFSGCGHGGLLHGVWLEAAVGPVSRFSQDNANCGPQAAQAASTTLTGTRTLWPSQHIAPAQPFHGPVPDRAVGVCRAVRVCRAAPASSRVAAWRARPPPRQRGRRS